MNADTAAASPLDEDLAFDRGAEILSEAIEQARSFCRTKGVRQLTAEDERELAEALLSVRHLVRSAVSEVDGTVDRPAHQRRWWSHFFGSVRSAA